MNIKSLRIFCLISLIAAPKLNTLEMVDIPEITFTRTDRDNNKQEVTVSPFYMSKYDVTVAEWFDYLDSSLETESKWKSNYTKEDFIPYMQFSLSECGFLDRNSIKINKDWPVFAISCNEALYYCNYLSEKEGLELCYEWVDDGSETGRVVFNQDADGYRLPTLAEWQAVSCIYTDTITEEYLMETNNLNTYGNFSKDKKPNKYGLVDIISDCAKFLWDYYDENELYLYSEVKDPSGSDKYTPDPNAVYYNEHIYETRYISRFYSDDKKLSNIDDFLKRPVSWITVHDDGQYAIRLCRNKK